MVMQWVVLYTVLYLVLLSRFKCHPGQIINKDTFLQSQIGQSTAIRSILKGWKPWLHPCNSNNNFWPPLWAFIKTFQRVTLPPLSHLYLISFRCHQSEPNIFKRFPFDVHDVSLELSNGIHQPLWGAVNYDFGRIGFDMIVIIKKRCLMGVVIFQFYFIMYDTISSSVNNLLLEKCL